MSLGRVIPVLAALAVAGCRPGPTRPAAPTPSPTGATFFQSVAPFSVKDSTGRELELAFLGGLNTPRPQLVDLDRDGDLDLVIQEYSGRMILLERDGNRPDGTPRFRWRSDQLGGIDVGEWSRFVDYDGDGVIDLFAELPNSYIRVYHGARSPGAPRGVPRFEALPDSLRDDRGVAIFADRQNIAQLVDLDCDGHLDLFIGRISGTILHYTQVDPKARTPVFRLVTDRFQDLEILTGQAIRRGGSRHGANTMAFVDYDGDGDLDLFWGDFFEPGLLLFENVGSCREPRLLRDGAPFPPGDPLATSGYNAPTFGDLDGDGQLDLLVGVVGGSYDPVRTTIENLHHLAARNGGRFEHRASQYLPMIDVGNETLPALVDDDGDGDLDLLLANKIEPYERKTARIYRFENVGTSTAPALRMRSALEIRGAYHLAPAFGDLDGDGTPEMVLGSYGARVALYRNEGTRDQPRYQLADSALVTVTRGSNTTPTLGDLDGDGDLDLVVGRGSGYLSSFRNDGTAAAPRFTLVSDEFAGLKVNRRATPLLFDVDGDGDLDLVVGSDAGGLILLRNRGDRRNASFQPDPSWRIETPILSAPSLGDLDGDGRLDLVVGTSGGGVLFFSGRPSGR